MSALLFALAVFALSCGSDRTTSSQPSPPSQIPPPAELLPLIPADIEQEAGEVPSLRSAAKAFAETTVLRGDVTRDDVVDMKDLLYLYGYLLMPETYSLGPNTYLADLNGDNQVDFVDATLLGTYLIDPSNNPHGIGQEIEAQLTASLSPDPTATEFFNEGHVWHTFTVQTNADSLQVTVNGPGTDVVLEIAGGRRPPGRSYCGPERSDSPSRPRRDGWKLHLAGCADGETRIVLADYATKEILGTPILSG